VEEAVICAGETYMWSGHESLGALTAAGLYYDTAHYTTGCDSVYYRLNLTVNQATYSTTDTTVCTFIEWHYNGGQPREYWSSGTYTDTLVNAAGCDSICTLNLNIKVPQETELSLVHKFGDRLLMINRLEINAMPGWENILDSLGTEKGQYVEWHEINPETQTDEIVGHGYTYSLPTGEPLPVGHTYYAYISIPGSDTNGGCGSYGYTIQYTIPARSQAAPALMPSLARPGEDVRVINLDPMKETTIRIYTTDGLLHRSYTVSGESTFTLRASENYGLYLVELVSDDLRTTLRYIVK
jgi:hypothetical protein